MNRTHATAAASLASVPISALTVALLMAACSTSPVPTPPASPTTTSITPTTISTAPSPVVTTTPTAPPKTAPAAGAGDSSDNLTPNRRLQLLTILKAVNPGVSTDETVLVEASLRVCTHIKAHEPEATVEAAIANEFANGPYTPSPEEAQAIDMAIAKTFCFG